ncbi:MAG TPA: CTP synthase [Candidatus Paceibacterota bacterium]|nr:CTP synthase [Candidatus Paceibacterota bacterium]
MAKNLKYIFVVGGVMSGVGKGITSASIGKILQARGFEVTSLKIDPYVNVDAGTMNPTEHGEVFVLDDGMECDQDMGNYERFLDRDLTRANYMTTGSIYLDVIRRERNLEYGGRSVSVVPYIPLEVIGRINRAAKAANADVALIEIGGTVGEYENILFLEAVRMLRLKRPEDVLLALVSSIPSLGAGGTELKTKPTQHAVRDLNGVGLQPDFIFGRAPVPLDKKRKEKLSLMCGVAEEDVISAPNVSSIYDVPLNFEREKLSDRLIAKLGLRSRTHDLKEWRALSRVVAKTAAEVAADPGRAVRIGVVGKYFDSGDFNLTDSYISVLEAIKHAAYHWKREPVIEWINSEEFEHGSDAKRAAALRSLARFDGVVIPGGFGSRGVEGKIAAIRYCREHKVPYFGLCYGMQLAVIEFARHVAGLKRANTTEIDPKTPDPVIDIMPEQKKNMAAKDYGATMRLGAYPASLKKGTIAYGAYGEPLISERHRHRYEVNPDFIKTLEKHGLVFSGFSPDRRLMEIAELPRTKHPFFLGSQFHPELKSRPLRPHPLFREFVKAAIRRK